MTLARKQLLLSILTLAGVSCSTVPKETPEGRRIQIIKSPFAETCIQLGKIKYDGTPFIHEKELTLIMKELAAQLKGNALRYDAFVPGVTGMSDAKGRGTVYRCHSKKLKKYKAREEDKEFGEAPGGKRKAPKEPSEPADTPPKTSSPDDEIFDN